MVQAKRIPKADDPFFVANAGQMFLLLSDIAQYPFGVPLNETLRAKVQALRSAAFEDGIDTIGVAESGLAE